MAINEPVIETQKLIETPGVSDATRFVERHLNGPDLFENATLRFTVLAAKIGYPDLLDASLSRLSQTPEVTGNPKSEEEIQKLQQGLKSQLQKDGYPAQLSDSETEKLSALAQSTAYEFVRIALNQFTASGFLNPDMVPDIKVQMSQKLDQYKKYSDFEKRIETDPRQPISKPGELAMDALKFSRHLDEGLPPLTLYEKYVYWKLTANRLEPSELGFDNSALDENSKKQLTAQLKTEGIYDDLMGKIAAHKKTPEAKRQTEHRDDFINDILGSRFFT